MTLHEIAAALALDDLTPELAGLGSREVSHGYVSDLLSDVLAHAPRGCVLVTLQAHMNVVAVAAAYAQAAAIVFPVDRRPEERVRLKAIEEEVPLYTTKESAFAVVGKLYALGIRGPSM